MQFFNIFFFKIKEKPIKPEKKILFGFICRSISGTF